MAAPPALSSKAIASTARYVGGTPDTRRVIVAQLEKGLRAGDNPLVVARRVGNAVTDLCATRAATIARTELMHAEWEQLRDDYRNDRHVAAWQWVARLDGRTCLICRTMHGVIQPKSEILESHPNCRCTMAPAIGRPWEEPKGPIPKEQTGEALFATLPAAQQRAILGRARYAEYKGGVRLRDMIQRTQHPVYGGGRALRPVQEQYRKPPPDVPPAPVGFKGWDRDQITGWMEAIGVHPKASYTRRGGEMKVSPEGTLLAPTPVHEPGVDDIPLHVYRLVADSMRRLYEAYPQVFGGQYGFRSLSVSNQPSTERLAYAAYRIMTGDMTLNAGFFTTAEGTIQMGQLLRAGVETGWAVDGSIPGIIYHEWGHALDAFVQFHPSMRYAGYTSPAAHDTYMDWRTRGLTEAPSRYGKTEEWEAVAEFVNHALRVPYAQLSAWEQEGIALFREAGIDLSPVG